ncbi:MAG: VOC family protein [Dehalococcoidia bacterium]
MPSPLVFFQITTPDLAAAKAFYGALFDWRVSDTGGIDPQGPADFDPKGVFREIEDGPAAATPWFRVSDVAATLERVPGAGGEVMTPVRRTPAGTDVALVRAPDGLVLGVVQA